MANVVDRTSGHWSRWLRHLLALGTMLFLTYEYLRLGVLDGLRRDPACAGLLCLSVVGLLLRCFWAAS